MTQKEWYKLKKGDWVKIGEKGTPRKILKASNYDGRTGCITLKQIGYSYLGNPKAGKTVVYVSCDCKMFNKIKKYGNNAKMPKMQSGQTKSY
jgi:hypothetical protein